MITWEPDLNVGVKCICFTTIYLGKFEYIFPASLSPCTWSFTCDDVPLAVFQWPI